MEIMDLVLRDRRSLEYGESCVGEDSLVRLACRPVFARHVAEVGGRSAPGEAVALIIGAYAVEPIAAGQLSLEVIDVGQLDSRHRALVVVAVLVQPRNWIRARTTIGWCPVLWDERGAKIALRIVREAANPAAVRQRWRRRQASAIGAGSALNPDRGGYWNVVRAT